MARGATGTGRVSLYTRAHNYIASHAKIATVAAVGLAALAGYAVRGNSSADSNFKPGDLSDLLDKTQRSAVDPAYQGLIDNFLASTQADGTPLPFQIVEYGGNSVLLQRYEQNGKEDVRASVVRDKNKNGIPDTSLDLDTAVEIAAKRVVGTQTESTWIAKERPIVAPTSISPGGNYR